MMTPQTILNTNDEKFKKEPRKYMRLYRELSVFYLTNTIDAHVSTSVGFGAPRPISYSIQHFL